MDGHSLSFMRLPFETLMALDSRALHYHMQPVHHLVRLVHIVSMAAFFGAIGLLDFRLMGLRGAVPLRTFAENVLPWLYFTFGIAFATGVALFLYDPVHVGSHAYFTPKLILIVLGVLNAGLFHRTSYLRALAAEGTMPVGAKLAGGVSLLIWTAVLVCACLNTEAAPKVFLR